MFSILYLKIYFKTLKFHKIDTFLNIINIVLNLVISLLLITVISNSIPSLLEWDIQEIILMYGCMLFFKGIADFFTSNLLSIENLIRTGELDKYFIKPVRIVKQIILEKIDISQVVNIIIGLTIIILQILKLETVNTFEIILIMCFTSIIGIMISFALKLIFISIAFWTLTSLPLALAVDNVSDFAKYPLDIYPSYLKVILLTAIPFGFIAYLPTALILTKINYWWCLFSSIITTSLFILSLVIWKKA